MKSFFEYLVNDFIIWGIIAAVAWRITKSVNKGETGQAVLAGVLGVIAYYFAKNPETVLNWGSGIISRIFGG
ncbi:TcpD family membrane protein [Streptococcus suis]